MALPSGLPESIAAEEDLSRFLTSSKYFNSIGVKAAAFLPGHDDATSVFRHGAEPAGDLWSIGQTVNSNVHGAAIVVAAHVRTVLSVIADEPPSRHANIVGWPVNVDPELQKAHRKELALVIAQGSELVLKPT
jgi:hypothetical protein